MIPLESFYWSCFDENGCITLSANMAAPDYRGRFMVYISVWDADDTGYARWREYPDGDSAKEAYSRAVETVSLAPNPLPYAWLSINGLEHE